MPQDADPVAPTGGPADPVSAAGATEAELAAIPVRRKLAFAAVVVLLVLLGSEGVCRIVRFAKGKVTNERYPSLLLYESHPYLNKAPVPGTRLIAYHDDRPPRAITINSLGFRGQEIAAVKPPGTFRIVCLGGSTTFGHAVGDEGTWCALLEARLAAAYPLRRFEVVNAGVPGYTTFESLIDYTTRIADLSPDAVIVYHGINELLYYADLAPGRGLSALRPIRTQGEISSWLLNHSAAYQGLTHVADRLFSPNDQRPLAAACPEFGPRAFRRNLRALIGMARDDGARVLLITQATLVEPAMRTAEDLQRARISPYTLAKLYGLQPESFVAALNSTVEIGRAAGREFSVPVLDFYRDYPKQPEYFTDSVHTSAAGEELFARRVADALSPEFLAPRPPPRPTGDPEEPRPR
ncbi:MAG: SGNH/GDSL hydrolase family protein [Planctomycetes bacterium]|nr:SGNH/GDSL hydrolase family protein [Planctomycetota bacterium]